MFNVFDNQSGFNFNATVNSAGGGLDISGVGAANKYNPDGLVVGSNDFVTIQRTGRYRLFFTAQRSANHISPDIRRNNGLLCGTNAYATGDDFPQPVEWVGELTAGDIISFHTSNGNPTSVRGVYATVQEL